MTVRFAREYKFGSRYCRVSVADFDHFVPVPSPGVEITLHRWSLSVKLQEKKKMREVSLSLDHQERYSAKYSRTVWESGKMRRWMISLFLTWYHATQSGHRISQRLKPVDQISTPSYVSCYHVTLSSLEELPSARGGPRYVSGICAGCGGKLTLKEVITRPGYWQHGTLPRCYVQVGFRLRLERSLGRISSDSLLVRPPIFDQESTGNA